MAQPDVRCASRRRTFSQSFIISPLGGCPKTLPVSRLACTIHIQAAKRGHGPLRFHNASAQAQIAAPLHGPGQ
jgi:hypothetical protein